MIYNTYNIYYSLYVVYLYRYIYEKQCWLLRGRIRPSRAYYAMPGIGATAVPIPISTQSGLRGDEQA